MLHSLRHPAAPMHCTLLIPDLLPPAELGAEPCAGLRVPMLATLLARGVTARLPPLAYEDWLCERFGVARENDLPLAALMLQADGGDPARSYWLCAEPIQLRVDRNRLIVAARIKDYTAVEAAELTLALNQHFKIDNIEFCAPTPARWYLRTERAPDLATTPLAQALNRSIKHHLPRGTDALAWHRIMNEAQMLLHTHPVNAAREARGAAAANSIWLWGGGARRTIGASRYTATWGGGAVVRALALATGLTPNELPATGGEWLSAAGAGHHLVVIDAPADALREGDIAGWRERLGAADAQWLQPLANALRHQAIDEIAIVACNRESMLEARVTRANLRRFWRRAQPLATYAHAA